MPHLCLPRCCEWYRWGSSTSVVTQGKEWCELTRYGWTHISMVLHCNPPLVRHDMLVFLHWPAHKGIDWRLHTFWHRYVEHVETSECSQMLKDCSKAFDWTFPPAGGRDMREAGWGLKESRAQFVRAVRIAAFNHYWPAAWYNKTDAWCSSLNCQTNGLPERFSAESPDVALQASDVYGVPCYTLL